jgi:hypothetical protein
MLRWESDSQRTVFYKYRPGHQQWVMRLHFWQFPSFELLVRCEKPIALAHSGFAQLVTDALMFLAVLRKWEE